VVGRHQVRGRLQEIWKRPYTRKGHFQIGDCQLQCRRTEGIAVSILSTSLR
jgi:hypothetical protein